MFLTTANSNRAIDAVAVRANTGKLRLYNGTQPVDANAALSGNTLLAELTFSATAFGAAASGTATANAITADSSADATGKPTFARIFESDGTTVVVQLRAALAWLGSTAYSIGDKSSNGANTYIVTTAGTSASSGGPTGTGTGITDGSVVWNFDGVNEVVMTGGSTITATGNVSVSACTLTQPA